MKNRKTIPIFISIILFITNIFSFSLVAYAEPTLDEDGHLHVYNWEDIKEVAPKFVYYLCAQASSIVSGDFYNYVSNQDAWESMWNENNISISEDGANIIASSDLTAYIKQALVEYAEETNGYTLVDTFSYNEVFPTHAHFNLNTQYTKFKTLAQGTSICAVSVEYNKLAFSDLDDIYENNSGIVFDNKSVGSVKIYNPSWVLRGFDASEWYFPNDSTISENGTSIATMFEIGNNRPDVASYIYWAFSFPPNGKMAILTRDGGRVRVFNSLDAYKNHLADVRTVYFGSDFYNEPTEITVSFDELANFDTTKIESLLTDIRNELGQEVDTLTEAEIEKIIDDVLGKYFEELKDLIQNLPTDSDKEESGNTEIVVNTDKDFFSEWFQKIIDKLEEVKAAVNGLSAENLINDIISFLDDGKDGAIDNATDIIGELVDTFDDDGEIDADDIGADDMVQALSGTAGKLKDKFPFSLPWDVFFLVSLLEAEPEAPKIKLPIVLERYGIEEYIEIDMSKFEVLSEICRGMLTITYAYGLLNLTYKVINIGKEG